MRSHVVPWPEICAPDDVPSEAFSELRDHGTRIIWGEGNASGRLMIVLDNPGARETKDGEPLVCPTRATLQNALVSAGVNLDEVYVTYLLKRRPVRAYDRRKAWNAYRPLLRRQVEETSPNALVCAGNVLVRALIDAESDVKATRGRVVRVFGVLAVATYHPLGARRRPSLFPVLVEDLRLAATLL